MTPPCGVPLLRSIHWFSELMNGALSHLSMYINIHSSLMCFRTARISNSWLMLSNRTFMSILRQSHISSIFSLLDLCINRWLVWTVPIGIYMEYRFYSRLQIHFHYHLSYSVSDCRNAESSRSAGLAAWQTVLRQHECISGSDVKHRNLHHDGKWKDTSHRKTRSK